jgi:copper(I)-binding protein
VRTGPRVTATGAALALAVALAGCGAGQQAQTSNQVTTSGGAEARAGSILVRDVAFTFDGPVVGDAVYRPGDDAPLQLTIVNDGTDDDRLVGMRSPVATSVRVTGVTRVPGGQVLTAGYDGPVSSIELPGTAELEVTLVSLTSPLRAALSYPVVLTFERAGDVRIEVPVENPEALPPRAADAEPDEVRTLETGPEVDPVAPVAPR